MYISIFQVTYDFDMDDIYHQNRQYINLSIIRTDHTLTVGLTITEHHIVFQNLHLQKKWHCKWHHAALLILCGWVTLWHTTPTFMCVYILYVINYNSLSVSCPSHSVQMRFEVIWYDGIFSNSDLSQFDSIKSVVLLALQN